MPIKWGSSGLVCISTNSNRVLAQRSLFLQLWEINRVSVVNVLPYTEFVRNVWFEKIIYQLFYFYLPLLSTGLLMRRICIYGRYDEKVWQITTGIPCFAFFGDCATRSQLSFLNSLITRAPSSVNCCRYLLEPILKFHSCFKPDLSSY